MARRDYDVIVIGGGAAGLAAAVSARDAGASVLLCEAGDRLGGTSAASGGLYYGAGTSLQRAQGVEDSADALYDHYMIMSRWEIEPAVGRRYADESGPALEWMLSLGIEFLPEVLAVGQSPVPRGHLPKDYGYGIIQGLSAAVSRGNIEVALNTRIQKLLTDNHGAVVGIRAEEVDVSAHAVILACGGLGAASKQLRQEYYPDAQQAGDEWNFYIGVESDRGDVIGLAEEVGAEISDLNRGMMLSSTTYRKENDSLQPGWPVWVNARGRRFINELIDYSAIHHNVDRQPGKIFYVIMDHDAFTRSPEDPRYRDSVIFKDVAAKSLDPDWLAMGLARNEIFQADTLEELGSKAGIEPTTLAATIAEYNEDALSGVDSHFFKDPKGMVPVSKPPFYAVPRRAAQICLSFVGPRIDADARVYARVGTHVPGLYAAGEAAGGTQSYYVASGAAIGNCIIFGRVAGRNAADYAAVRARTEMESEALTADA